VKNLVSILRSAALRDDESALYTLEVRHG
jgi:hypothetical protein